MPLLANYREVQRGKEEVHYHDSHAAYFISFMPHFEGLERLNFERQDVEGRRFEIVSAAGAKF